MFKSTRIRMYLQISSISIVGSCKSPTPIGAFIMQLGMTDKQVCWEGCAPEEVEIGQMFSQQRCAAVVCLFLHSFPDFLVVMISGDEDDTDRQGVTISTSAISNIAGPTPTESSPASITSVLVTGTPESWTEAPVLYKQTLVNIQAIVRFPSLPFLILYLPFPPLNR